jgi:hypothetical protein
MTEHAGWLDKKGKDITPSAHKGQKKTSGPISGLGIRGIIVTKLTI